MGIQTAAVLYLVNTTTVDTPTGGDIRLLDSAQAGPDDNTQTVTATHTQDNVERTFDPATGGVTTVNEVGTGTLQFGWGLRLTEDMTPSDDTNCNAALTSGTLTINLQAAVSQSGGTYVSGNYSPTWKAALWRYDPSTDAQTLIESVASVATPTWNITPGTGDLGTFKAVSLSLVIDPLVEFAAGEILVLELGLNTGTIPNPTIGTATWTYTLRVDNSGTNITFASGQGIRTLCPIDGTSSGLGDASGVPVTIVPQVGTSTGIADVAGILQAEANISGTSSGTVSVTGDLQATAEMTGISESIAIPLGILGAVLGTVGTCNIGEVSDPEPEPEVQEVATGGGGVRFISLAELNLGKIKRRLEDFLNKKFTNTQFNKLLESIANKFDANRAMIDPMLTDDEEALIYIILVLESND